MSRRTLSLPPFPAEYRASGLLLHVTSLPSPYGIGDVGPAALSWIDRLHEAGQSWWQALPGFGAGLLISVVTTPVGVSGAVFLLPAQLSVLQVPSPAVTPTRSRRTLPSFERARRAAVRR